MSGRNRLVASVAFVALAAFTAFHWFALVADVALWRWGLSVVVAAAGAVVLESLRPLARRRVLVLVLASLVLVATLVGGLLVTGVNARFLWPAGWDELATELGRGLAGVSQAELPYEGPDSWTGLGILLGAPLTLTLAVALAFWPLRRSGGGRAGWILGLVSLLFLYGIAVTWEAPSSELARGLPLFVLIAAVLWLPRLRSSRALAAGAAVALAGLAALPVATRVDASDPLVSYTDWKVFGEEEIVTFDWDHTYGPLDWPQEGTEVLRVRSDEPLYWKTSVLDFFDGTVWSRSGDSFGEEGAEFEVAGATEELVAENPRWVSSFDVEVAALRSDLAITAGSRSAIDGLDLTAVSGDGTTSVEPELTEGSSYSVTTYAPTPTARALRRGPDSYPRGLERYTTLLLPQELGLPAATADPLLFATVPPQGADESRAEERRGMLVPSIEPLVTGTAYERVFRLAQRLTRGAKSDYAAVASIERHLLENYEYEQEVPERARPLPDFLFRDKVGYCQQFSGAMALMLRMVGIPSRVVSGFAPGLPDSESGSYIVRDTDAHSWVEVYFPDVGWVTVDPTPSAAPARAEEFANVGEGGGGAGPGLGRAFSIEGAADAGPSGRTPKPAARADAESESSPLPFLAVLAVLGVGGAVGYRRRRRLVAPEGAGPQLRELMRALPRTSRATPPGTTLLGVERRLEDRLGPEAAAYASGLRENRYRSGNPRRPGPAERSAFRRALAHGSGPLGWLRAIRAIPPGGPRR